MTKRELEQYVKNRKPFLQVIHDKAQRSALAKERYQNQLRAREIAKLELAKAIAEEEAEFDADL